MAKIVGVSLNISITSLVRSFFFPRTYWPSSHACRAAISARAGCGILEPTELRLAALAELDRPYRKQ
jgi:hypothetical protein